MTGLLLSHPPPLLDNPELTALREDFRTFPHYHQGSPEIPLPTPVVHSKYYLKSLHEEIALFDRKLAHLLRYETFPSEKDRNAAAAKMSVKRGQLVQTARQLVEEGIEFQASELPRSLRPEQPADAVATQEAVPADSNVVLATEPEKPAKASSSALASPFREDIREYLAKRKKLQQN